MAGAQNNFIQLGGLWLKKSEKAGTFMTGPLTQTTRLYVFKNAKKPKGSQNGEPDYFLYMGPNTPPAAKPSEPPPQKSQENPPDPDGSYT